jgi:hypothetical protein
VNCLAVRDRLPEHALHLLEEGEATSLERHVEWCAGCRKEVSDLTEAAGTLPLALVTPAPAADLEDRVVVAIRSASGAGRSHGRFRGAAAALIAAFVAVAALGWGAVMAGRAERFSDRAQRAVEQRNTSIANFAALIDRLPGSVPQDHPRLGELTPTAGHGSLAGGAALMLTSGEGADYAFVILSGADQERVGPLPYKVYLRDASDATLTVGRVSHLDSSGSAQLFRAFDRDILPFARVVVKDANGDTVMRGTIGTESTQK